MKVKNEVVLALARVGAQNIVVTSVEAAYAYKCIKFRRAVSKAFDELKEAERSLIKSCDLTVGENGIVEGDDKSKEKYRMLRDELLADTVELGDVGLLPFDVWCELKKENKLLGNAVIEDSLEGILWAAPLK